MDSAHIGINLSDRNANYDVADVAQPRNVSESQHGNDDFERNSTTVLKPVEKDDAGIKFDRLVHMSWDSLQADYLI
jgi:hypothetical protein